MSEDVSFHVVAPSGSERERIAGALAALDPRLHDSLEDLRAGEGADRRVVVVDVDGGVDCHALLGMCREVADGAREWILLLSERSGDGSPVLRPLSAGFPVQPDRLADVVATDGDRPGPLMDLHDVLRFVGRIRHDLNNPLTAGLAETQLLSMDLGEEGEVGESLETIQRQLKRIRDLVQELSRLRPPLQES